MLLKSGLLRVRPLLIVDALKTSLETAPYPFSLLALIS